MLLMAKKKDDSKRAQGVDRHLKPRVAFHLDRELLDALELHIKNSRPRPTTTAVIVTAIEEYLTSRQCWPAKDAEGAK
jgi:hypothetical protein